MGAAPCRPPKARLSKRIAWNRLRPSASLEALVHMRGLILYKRFSITREPYGIRNIFRLCCFPYHTEGVPCPGSAGRATHQTWGEGFDPGMYRNTSGIYGAGFPKCTAHRCYGYSGQDPYTDVCPWQASLNFPLKSLEKKGRPPS